QMLPRQTKRILTARLFYAVAPPIQAGAQGAAVLRCFLRHGSRLLLVLRAHRHCILLSALGITRAPDDGASETTEDCSRAPVPSRGDRRTEDGARDGPDSGAGARRRTARNHPICRRNIGRAGIEARLLHGPHAAVITIPALLIGRLAALRIGIDRRI